MPTLDETLRTLIHEKYLALRTCANNEIGYVINLHAYFTSREMLKHVDPKIPSTWHFG